ncbi:MAG TPA: GreA/GreB family elongation factor [Candidatus Pacearchaeota archaeon]|nr:GreA/GreB family elongation factor [Candidatus Pacearchaeota archaeon]HPR79825.1 GreA/GreB family elongation factor [Candidatus Pacearchaeota archaeon]
MIKTFYLTREGLEKIKKEYEDLKSLQRNEILESAPSMLEGDALNPDYSFFKENLEELEKRIEELDNILKNYKIIRKPGKSEQDRVSLGAKVVLKNDSSNHEEYKIVGTLEADPFKGLISDESPLGMSFIGKRVGESISFNGNNNYKILKIQYEES